MNYSALRNQFLNYYQGLDHNIVASSSLIPADDPTILFTNAGMNQFKNSFLGIEAPISKRIVSAQRCVRAGGKHNDLENVGYTARHHTFFEMLGNFSFGDYFKLQAIEYSWSFVTKHLNLPLDRLWVTVHHQDDESEQIWHKHIGIPLNRIIRCSDKDNFWSMGDRGPCGPCTEIFYDHGPSVQGGPPGSPHADGDRYMEIWNLVFMQYDRQADGSLLPLPAPCVDTGMGLERLACVSEGVYSNFDTSLFRALKKPIAERVKVDLVDPRLNVIADHLRAATFIIADGMTPASEGRGYVLRRLIRRALSHGYKLGMKTPFLSQYVSLITQEMGDAYPFLLAQENLCKDILAQEENLFHHTLQSGLKYVHQALERSTKMIKGDDLFKLYDTYGFPIDIARDIAKENNLDLDQEGFDVCMRHQKEQSKSDRQQRQWTVSELPADHKQIFHRDRSECSAVVLASYTDCDRLKSWVCLDQTVFYAESGGQVGDTGALVTAEGVVSVLDTQKALHFSMVLTDRPKEFWRPSQSVHASIDTPRRHQVECHHTATHLLHAALHHVLGADVMQRGSHVGPERLRLDIAYDRPLTATQKSQLEDFCQQHVDAHCSVNTQIMSQEDALATGAMAIFGDKYGATVRVLSIGDNVSKELCGGTHIANLVELSTLIILSDEPLSSGVRRIQALSGPAAIRWLRDRSEIVSTLSAQFQSASSQIIRVVSDLQIQHNNLMKSVDKLRQSRLLEILKTQGIQKINTHPVVFMQIDSEDKSHMNILADHLNMVKGFDHAIGLTALVWIKEEDKYTLLLIQEGNANLDLQGLSTVLKEKLAFKGGGRPKKIQLGGVFHGNIQNTLIDGINQLSTV